MPSELGGVREGDKVERAFAFTPETIGAFSDLVGDKAPVHFDEGFAKSQGFDGRIVHGFLVGSIFSGMLGEELPGPRSVINSLSLKFHRPIYVGETVNYEVAVCQVSPAARAFVLTLKVTNAKGEQNVSGQSICSFPG